LYQLTFVYNWFSFAKICKSREIFDTILLRQSFIVDLDKVDSKVVCIVVDFLQFGQDFVACSATSSICREITTRYKKTILNNKEQNSTYIYKKSWRRSISSTSTFTIRKSSEEKSQSSRLFFFLHIAVEVIADDNFVNLIGLRARTVTRNDFYPIRWAVIPSIAFLKLYQLFENKKWKNGKIVKKWNKKKKQENFWAILIFTILI